MSDRASTIEDQKNRTKHITDYRFLVAKISNLKDCQYITIPFTSMDGNLAMIIIIIEENNLTQGEKHRYDFTYKEWKAVEKETSRSRPGRRRGCRAGLRDLKHDEDAAADDASGHRRKRGISAKNG